MCIWASLVMSDSESSVVSHNLGNIHKFYDQAKTIDHTKRRWVSAQFGRIEGEEEGLLSSLFFSTGGG